MSKSAQDLFNELIAERDKLKEEISKWIYTASVLERERDDCREDLSLLAQCLQVALNVFRKKI